MWSLKVGNKNTNSQLFDVMFLSYVNPLVPGVHEKVTHA